MVNLITIESAVALDSQNRQALETLLLAKFPQANFDYQVNPALLFGLKINFSGQVIDLTGKQRLSLLSK